jgi:hypothetical protein
MYWSMAEGGMAPGDGLLLLLLFAGGETTSPEDETTPAVAGGAGGIFGRKSREPLRQRRSVREADGWSWAAAEEDDDELAALLRLLLASADDDDEEVWKVTGWEWVRLWVGILRLFCDEEPLIGGESCRVMGRKAFVMFNSHVGGGVGKRGASWILKNIMRNAYVLEYQGVV